MSERPLTAPNSSSDTTEKLVCEDIASFGLKMVPFPSAVLFRSVSVVLCVFNSFLCPLTVAGNILVFMAVLRKVQLRTVANTSTLCLAFTDLMVGVFVQPSYVVYQASKLTASLDSFPCDKLLIYSFSGVTCICMSFLTLILISMERYLAVFYPYIYEAKVNSRRVILVTVTSFVYFKIFRLVKRCNAQVNVEMSQHTGSTSEGTENDPPTLVNSSPREAKASKTVAFVAGTLFLCFMPTLCVTIVDQAGLAPRDLLYHVIYPIAETAVLLNSCVNPGIYVWRNRGIRRSLRELLSACKLGS